MTLTEDQEVNRLVGRIWAIMLEQPEESRRILPVVKACVSVACECAVWAGMGRWQLYLCFAYRYAKAKRGWEDLQDDKKVPRSAL